MYKTLEKCLQDSRNNSFHAYNSDFDESDDEVCGKPCSSLAYIALEDAYVGSKLDWIECDYCKHWFHKQCTFLVSLNETSKNPAKYKCHYCSFYISNQKELFQFAVERLENSKKLYDLALANYNSVQEKYVQTDKLINSNSSTVSGCTQLLEQSLDKLKVDRLAYHTLTFVGNPIKIMLRNIDELTSAMGTFDENRRLIYKIFLTKNFILFGFLKQVHFSFIL